MNTLFNPTESWIPLVAALLGVGLFLFFANWLLITRHPDVGDERKIRRQLTMLALSVVGIVVIALALPVSEDMRKQVLALIGVLLSGMLAFSSTTLISSFMAGLMLHITKPFRIGDFIRVGDYFGRVSEQGLFDTEMQTEQRELVHLSNTFIVSNPVTVVRSSGTIVTASLSLGYDVHHARVCDLLVAAAEETELQDSFVQIMELGNDSVTYRVSGLLIEVKGLLTARSHLYRNILDALHADGIEIVSPSFVNQRRLADGATILPLSPNGSSVIASDGASHARALEETSPEEIVFDKAEAAEQHENAKQHLQDEIAELQDQASAAPRDEKKRLSDSVEMKRQKLGELNKESETKGKTGPADIPESPTTPETTATPNGLPQA